LISGFFKNYSLGRETPLAHKNKIKTPLAFKKIKKIPLAQKFL
jgi:hypothetical protein